MKFLIVIFVIFVSVNSHSATIGKHMEMSRQYQTGDEFMGIRLLGTLDLSGLPIKGMAAHELSGLAWDEDDQILYAVSDKGYLVHLRPIFVKNILKNIELLDAYYLLNKEGKKVSKPDSEGLDIINGDNGIKGDAELIVSFELKPRIYRYTTKGKFLEKYKLPKTLNKINDYDYKNAALESFIIHPQLGYLTAPQMPLKKAQKNLRSIHDLKGKSWQFKPQDEEHSSITDLEITEDGSVLILERRYSNILAPIQSIIRKIKLNKSDENNKVLPTETVALFESSKGWNIDNFEGLTHHKDKKYFMVSDDNNNLFQRTILVYFELLEKN